MRPFQLSLRFIVPLALVLGAFALVMLPLIDELTERWFLRDLDSRSQVLATSLREPLADLVSMQDAESIQTMLDRSVRDAHTRAIAFCDMSGRLLYHSNGFPPGLSCLGSAPPGLRVAEVPHVT
jgi:trehalose 6-phosphate synthase